MYRSCLIILLFANLSGFGQTHYLISGKITDEQNTPVAVGDILLYEKDNDALLQYTTVNKGRFLFEAIPFGRYRLQISCLGYEVEELHVVVDSDQLFTIRLQESRTDLDEVTVTAAKPMVTNRNGNLEIDVTNPVFSSIPDPVDLLSKFPGIRISPDRESITVLGKGIPLIYLGNQRISLEEFKALSVATISSIEIVRNPSAKYEAEGRAVLLITSKSMDSEGVMVNLSEMLSFKRNFNNYNGINLNLGRNKLSLKTSFGYNDLQTWESNSFEFSIPAQNAFSDYLVLIEANDRKQINMGVGLSYEINETDYFSANTNIRLQTDTFPIDTDTFLRQGLIEDTIVTRTLNDNSKDFVSANLNYNKKLGNGMNVFTGLQYSSFVQELDTDIFNNFNDTGLFNAQDRYQKYRIGVLAYRFDIEKTFGNNFKWEIGANLSEARANAFTEILFFQPDSLSTIDYDYSEQLYASYTQLSVGVGEKMNFNAGLRVEKNNVKGGETTQTIPLVDRQQTNFFPKAMFNIALDSTKSITVNYAKNITRPNYSRASSITAFINPFLEGSGNVNLVPTLTEELSTVFQLKNNSFTISYSSIENPTYFTIAYDDQLERAVLSQRNLDKEYFLELALNMPFTSGIWTSTNYGTLSMRRIEDPDAAMGSSKPYFYLYTNHQFKVGKDMTLAFGGWGLTDRYEGVFKRNGLLVLEAAITKTFFEKLDCSLRFNDITRAMNFEESYAVDGVEAQGAYFADAREIVLSLKYSFGKVKDLNYKNKDIDQGLDRIR
ncbi:TonB-dependent receptor [Flavobacteriaceae bacterium TP-CH-4]|uniref:TonB-dependent receptor n=1 Tax=Pelagihabitans pacificus TaxID=2696054 RepID=A0A967B0L6_9FLAO|nr:outer membrane beta-barrel family protein [Pelagihabitans pacificus]NHF60927.1 TonB-dependent receptor [Pelagihabitans pacificus]